MRGYRKDEFFRKESNGICAGWYCSSRAFFVKSSLLRLHKKQKQQKQQKRQSLRSLRKRKKQGMDFSWMTKPVNGTCMWMAR